MNSIGNFQFHKFNLNSQRNFYNSNEFTEPIRSRTYSNGFYNIFYEKSKGYQNYIPTNFSQENLSKTNMNLLNKLSQDKYPKKKILNYDFESMLKYGDFNKIDELLPHMIYNDLSFSKNNHLRLVLGKFQTLLKFLFSQQKIMMNKNNNIEEMFNNKNSNMNEQIRKMENEEHKISKLFKSNNNQIEQLNKKIKTYKTILKNSGKEYLIPKNYDNVKKYNKNGLYYCQICFGKAFKSYEDYQDHFLKKHTNNINNKISSKPNYNTYNNISKNYLDNRLSTLKKEMTNLILNMQEKSNNNLDNDINNIDKLKSKTNNNINMNNYNILNENEEKINAHLNRLEYEQKEQYEQLNSKLNQMKNEVFNELKNLRYKPSTTINNNVFNEEEKKKIEESKKEDLKIINEKTNGTLNLINNNQNISSNDQNQNIQKNEIIEVPNISSNKNTTSNNLDINNNEVNNKEFGQINLNQPSNNINDEIKNEPENNIINNQKKENDGNNKTNNIANNNSINEDINQNDKNDSNDIVHSTGKYINKSKIIQEESGRKESTILNQTPNNINNQDNILDDKDKILPNIGDSVINSQNKLFAANNLNDAIKFSSIKNPIEEKEFINKIKERDEKILLNNNKNLNEIEEDYGIIKLKNSLFIENKEDNLIKELEKRYFGENPENLGKDDLEKRIENIIQTNFKNLENNKIYKEFFNNLIKKNELTEFLPKDKKISKINESENKNQFDEENKFNRNESLANNFNFDLDKNLGKGNYEDFL